jgi:hypothetical protein
MTSDGASAFPAGPWLLVVGMHRSGTSAMSGVLGALGLSVPQASDLVHWKESNAEHWESAALTEYDDDLLASLGGNWEAPPDFPAHWEAEVPEPRIAAAGSAAWKAFPEPGPLVWKDPRLCLLLPYWRRVLPQPLAAVLVWRSPLSVAASLRKRDGMHLADGIALWERYNHAALANLAGVDTYVCSYDALLEEPKANVAALAEWLRARPQFAAASSAWNEEAAVATISGGGGRDAGDETSLLLPSQQDLIRRLHELDGGHLPLGASPLAEESGWTTALLAARQGSRTREFQIEIANKQRQLEQMRNSSSWRLTKPLRWGLSALGELRSKARG